MPEHEPTYCNCPAVSPTGKATISRQGMCPTCGVEGPDHQNALREHLAAGNPRPLLDRARAEGRKSGYELGKQAGHREAVEALAEREVEQRPFCHEPDFELEAG
jgi:hypothetical protein